MLYFPDIDAYARSAAAEQETFGPIVNLIRYQSLDAVVAFIRQREKPLATYVFAAMGPQRPTQGTVTDDSQSLYPPCPMNALAQ